MILRAVFAMVVVAKHPKEMELEVNKTIEAIKPSLPMVELVLADEKTKQCMPSQE